VSDPASIQPSSAKILSREELSRVRSELRARGTSVVACHGCFDIVHPGHIRHLRQAKALGHVLLVSITADDGISKGQGRPLIPEELRAENLAALEFVDFVHIAREPTAVALLEMVQPDVYVKGKEYERNKDPRFQAEREVVERHGGRVVFTSGDVVFSSTALIAAMEQSVDPFAQRLSELTHHPELSGPELYKRLAEMRGRRVLIVGEPIIDTYILCDRPDVAGESPIMTLRPLEARNYDGGAMVLARHAAALGAKPVLVAPFSKDLASREAMQRMIDAGVEVVALPVSQPVPEKQRFLVGAQKVMKVDLFERYVLDTAQQDQLAALAVDVASATHAGGTGAMDGAIIADFGLGLFTPRSLGRLCESLRSRVHIMSGDVSSKRSNLRAFRDMDLLCPSESELRESMQSHGDGLGMVAWSLMNETRTARLCVTMGADGLITFDRIASPVAHQGGDAAWQRRLSSAHVPALCPIALDPLGCGDALLTSTTLALASGASSIQAAFIGACAAATQVQRLGNPAITTDDIRKCIARVHASHLAYAPEHARGDATPALAS